MIYMGAHNENDDGHNNIFSSSFSNFVMGGRASWIEFVHNDDDEKLLDIQTSQNVMDFDMSNQDDDPLLFLNFENIDCSGDKAGDKDIHNVIEVFFFFSNFFQRFGNFSTCFFVFF